MPNTLTLVHGIGPEVQEPLVNPAEQSHDELRATFATDAVEKIFEWLAYAPNNPSYLTSETYRLPKAWLETHLDALHQVVADGTQELSEDHEAVDLYHLEVLKTGVVVHRNQKTNALEPLVKHFVASDFMNAGIRDIIDQANADTIDTKPELISEHAVRAIGAMLLRAAYFTHLANEYPESFTEHDRDTFHVAFRQNILATVFIAARLSSAAALNEQQPAPKASALVEAAA